jgi:hypothetical protein
MALIALGRAPEPKPAAAARDPRGVRASAARVDLDALAETVFSTRNPDDKARLFVAYLRALGLVGHVLLTDVEERYWEIAGASCRTHADWQSAWRSISRALGKICVKKQRWDRGERRSYLTVPPIASVQ